MKKLKNSKFITEKIYRNNLPTLRRWKKKTKSKSIAELIDKIINHIDMKTHNILYNKLTTKDNFKRPLSRCKIERKKTSILNNGAAYR